MEQLQQFINEIIETKAYKIIVSNPNTKSAVYKKITYSLYEQGYLCEQLTATQAFHKTVNEADLKELLEQSIINYSQINAWSEATEFSARVTKKGKPLISKRLIKGKTDNAPAKLTGHNREKNYILKEGSVIPPLVDMGVLTPDGKVVKAMSDKLRQINRFLEIIDDVIKENELESLNIIDFGCGKSYLTFVLYYYFTEIKKLKIKMTGVDLKKDVIEFCSALSQKYGYENLSFEVGDIEGYKSKTPVDMVISLHACDTATDYALFNAICWDARFIFSVPCCQHEVNEQINCSALPIFKEYGIIKSRFSELLTDAIRGNLLTYCGYKTQIMEFVDLSHTPKNLLIRAQKELLSKQARMNAYAEAKETCDKFGINQTLVRLIDGLN